LRAFRNSRQNTRSVFPKEYRAKAARIAIILESVLGKPVQAEILPDPLEMLIATILSQNTNDKNSHRAYTQLVKRFRRWEDIAHAPVRSIVSAIRVGGMANQKAPRIKETLLAVRNRFGSFHLGGLKRRTNEAVMKELVDIKGVGVKTAACVLLFSLGRDVFPVDTHVHRLCARLGIAPNCSTPEKTFQFMQRVFPKGKGYSFHTNLIRFGRRVCRANKPACDVCPLYGECTFTGKKKRTRITRFQSRADHDFMLLDNVRVAS
jgi:endonuclease III